MLGRLADHDPLLLNMFSWILQTWANRTVDLDPGMLNGGPPPPRYYHPGNFLPVPLWTKPQVRGLMAPVY